MAYGFYAPVVRVPNNSFDAAQAMLAISGAITHSNPALAGVLNTRIVQEQISTYCDSGQLTEQLRAKALADKRGLKAIIRACKEDLSLPQQIALRHLSSRHGIPLVSTADALSTLMNPRRHQAPVALGRQDLTAEEVIDVARHGRRVILDPEARERVARNRLIVEEYLKPEAPAAYGINTGFGSNAHVRISASDLERLQTNLIRSHAAGVGNPIEDDYVRAMMLLRAASLVQAKSGVRPEVIEQLVAFLNRGIHPIVSEKGSVGASGDLVPLSQIAQALTGEGRVRLHGKEMSAAEALRSTGLRPLNLKAKEGLALINGTQFITAVGLLQWEHARHLLQVSHIVTALVLEAERGTAAAYHPSIHEARRQDGQIKSARILRDLLMEHGRPSPIGQSHVHCQKVQDPYHLRCAPQVLGAVLACLTDQGNVFSAEINAVTDNPIITESGVFSGGNFHGMPVAMAADFIAASLVTAINLHQSQIAALLTNTRMTGLPAFLVACPENAGIQSGMMMLDVVAAALAAEARTLAGPASVHSLPTAGYTEDHVSMGPIASRKLGEVVKLLQDTLALGLATAAQGIDLIKGTDEGLRTTRYLESVLKEVRNGVAFMDEDRSMTDDLAYLSALLASGQLEGPFQRHLSIQP